MEGWLSWSKAPDSKSGVRAIVPWVRIPPLPPRNQGLAELVHIDVELQVGSVSLRGGDSRT
jgi:hypothetical protein